MRLSYQGIGASLQTVDDYVTIMNIIPGGPAAKSGQLKANYRITAVAQGKSGEMVDVVGWRLDDVVQLIRGPADSVVRLSILPGGASPGSKEVVQEYQRGTVTLRKLLFDEFSRGHNLLVRLLPLLVHLPRCV